MMKKKIPPPKHIIMRFQNSKNDEKDSKRFQVQRDKDRFPKNNLESKRY